MTEIYVHYPPDTRVDSISGHFVIQEEKTFSFRDRSVLVVFGYGVVEKSCCGSGGCRFARIPGYVSEWKSSKNEEGLLVSVVDPVEDKEEQQEIERMVDKMELYCQVLFY